MSNHRGVDGTLLQKGQERPYQQWPIEEEPCETGASLIQRFALKGPNGSSGPLQQQSMGAITGDRVHTSDLAGAQETRGPLQPWDVPQSHCADTVNGHCRTNGSVLQKSPDGSRGPLQQAVAVDQRSRMTVPLSHFPSENSNCQRTFMNPSLLGFDSGWDCVQGVVQRDTGLWDVAGQPQTSPLPRAAGVDMATRQHIDEFDTLIEKIDLLNDLSLGSPAGHPQKQQTVNVTPRNPHQDSVDDDFQNLLEQNPSLLDPSLSTSNRFACDSGIGASLVTTPMTPYSRSCLDSGRTDTSGSVSANHDHDDMMVDDDCGSNVSPRSFGSKYSTVNEIGHAAVLTPPVSPLYGHLDEHQAASSYYSIANRTPIRRPGPPSLKLATMATRTNLKQYLQMQQVQEQERKEQEQAKQATVAPSKNTQAVNVPPTTTVAPRMDVPSEVLKVNSRLENPTQFHVIESRKRQVQEYLSTAQGNGRSLLVQSVPSKGATQGASASAPTVTSISLQHLSNSAPSPESPNSVALSSSATSASEADVIESIIQMESSMDTDGSTLLQTSTMPPDCNFLDIIKNCGVASPASSKSCPSDGNVKQEAFRFGDCSIQSIAKDRQKKDNHNMIERRRRFNINDRIKELATLLPKNNDPYFDVVRVERQNKGTILKASVDFIKELKREVDRLSIEAKEKKRLEHENWRLKHQFQQFVNTHQPITSESSPDITYLLNTSGMTLPKEDEGHIMVKQEPIDALVDHHHLLSPASMDDLMEDDRHPVNGDPMLPCTLVDDVLLNDGMEFTS